MTGAAVVQTLADVAECTSCGCTQVFLARLYDGAIIDSAWGTLGPNGWVCDPCQGPEAQHATHVALARWGTL